VSPFPVSVVSGTALPPAAGTRESPALNPAVKTIVLSGPQAPPRAAVADVITVGVPPESGVRMRLPFAKNATNCPSGEKKGW